jgi:xanthine dehydrogenase accessory factor
LTPPPPPRLWPQDPEPGIFVQDIAAALPSEASGWSLPEWPAFGVQSDIRPALALALEAGRPVVLGTLHSHEGAAPLGEGAQILFDGGAAAGFLSGGCVEGDVALHARAVLADGDPRRLVYGRGGPPDIQLLCGSRIEVLLERIDPDDEAALRLLALSRDRRPALWLSDGRAHACLAEADGGETLPTSLRPALASAAERPAVSDGVGPAIFRRYAPRPRLVVVGGDPITLAIARLASDAGFETSLVRPKGPAAPPPLPGVRYFRGEPAEAFAELGLDLWTAVAVATHDIDIDHDALRAVLPSKAGYVGALGSRRRLPERLARLRADGVSDAALARLNAPIGLNIGARAPWEVAVSVVAEVIQSLKAQDAGRLWTAGAA